MDKNKIPLNIYLDLSKAFETLDHAIFLDTLFYYVIRGNPLKLISSYLENRQQFVEFRNTKSNILGSISGPLLFLIYINHKMISHQQAATSTLSRTQTTPFSIAILTRQTKII